MSPPITAPVPPAPSPADLTGDTRAASAAFFIDRHNNSVNVGFLGGNASTVKLSELTQLDWYNGAGHATLAQNWLNVVNK